MDDVLIFGSNQRERDTRLTTVLERLESRGVTLNIEKCEFSTNSMKFLGHIVDRKGIRADTDKTGAIQELDRPENGTELRRILGMANQLGKFSPTLAEVSQPLRELLSTKRAWVWTSSQECVCRAEESIDTAYHRGIL